MPLVSVIVVTYNHDAYISQALESILMQKTSFSYEIIIGNDASKDKTRQILLDYKKKFPDIIVLQDNEMNLGVLGNVLNLINKVKGKYFAILDGDDFWTYEHKLQKQIEFLEKNTEYAGVFHDTSIHVIDEEANNKLFKNKYLYSQNYSYKEIIDPADIVKRLILPSSAAVYRVNKDILKDLNLLKDNLSIFWKISCFLIKNSKFYYINEVWSAYRNHKKGISKTNNIAFHLSHIEFLESLLLDTFYKYYSYDIYVSICKELEILLESNDNGLNKKSLFKKYKNYSKLKIKEYKQKVL